MLAGPQCPSHKETTSINAESGVLLGTTQGSPILLWHWSSIAALQQAHRLHHFWKDMCIYLKWSFSAVPGFSKSRSNTLLLVPVSVALSTQQFALLSLSFHGLLCCLTSCGILACSVSKWCLHPEFDSPRAFQSAFCTAQVGCCNGESHNPFFMASEVRLLCWFIVGGSALQETKYNTLCLTVHCHPC